MRHDPKLGEIRFSHSIIIISARFPEPFCSFFHASTLRYIHYHAHQVPLWYTIKLSFKFRHVVFCVCVCAPPPPKKKWYSGRRTRRHRHRHCYHRLTRAATSRPRMYFIGMQIRRRGLVFLSLALLSFPVRYFYDIAILSMGTFVLFFGSCLARYLQSRGPSPHDSRRHRCHHHKILSCAQIRIRERRPRPEQVGVHADDGDIVLPKVYARIL